MRIFGGLASECGLSCLHPPPVHQFYGVGNCSNVVLPNHTISHHSSFCTFVSLFKFWWSCLPHLRWTSSLRTFLLTATATTTAAATITSTINTTTESREKRSTGGAGKPRKTEVLHHRGVVIRSSSSGTGTGTTVSGRGAWGWS